jgi:CopG family nickel-responsive transcriptional regulator
MPPDGRSRTGTAGDAGRDTVRFTVSLPRELLDRLDDGMLAGGCASRSKFVRDLVRERLVKAQWREHGREVVGVLTICYDHHRTGLTGRITRIQHDALVNILCTTHVHLDHDHCLEALILRGRPAEIEMLATRIGGLRGVDFAELSRAGIL